MRTDWKDEVFQRDGAHLGERFMIGFWRKADSINILVKSGLRAFADPKTIKGNRMEAFYQAAPLSQMSAHSLFIRPVPFFFKKKQWAGGKHYEIWRFSQQFLLVLSHQLTAPAFIPLCCVRAKE